MTTPPLTLPRRSHRSVQHDPGGRQGDARSLRRQGLPHHAPLPPRAPAPLPRQVRTRVRHHRSSDHRLRPEVSTTASLNPSPLRDYCKTIGVKYFYESRAVIALAKKKLQNGSICSWCSRMKRGILYSTLRREGYNVLVPIHMSPITIRSWPSIWTISRSRS